MRGRTYRYLEEKPLYPFGYGLTYGEARVIKTEFVKQPKRTEDLIIQVMVENVSARTIRDVVQVYIQNNDSIFCSTKPGVVWVRKHQILWQGKKQK